METQIREELAAAVERLGATAGLLERAVERLAQRETELAVNAASNLDRIVATVDTTRERDLEDKLAVAEQKIAALEARTASALSESPSGRRTMPASVASLAAKHGVGNEAIQAGALDAALVHLSLEQRIAVKADLMRAGMIA